MEDHVNQLIKTQMINARLSLSVRQRTRVECNEGKVPADPTDVSRRRRASMTSSGEKLDDDN